MRKKYPTANIGLHLASTSVAIVTATDLLKVDLLQQAKKSY